MLLFSVYLMYVFSVVIILNNFTDHDANLSNPFITSGPMQHNEGGTLEGIIGRTKSKLLWYRPNGKDMGKKSTIFSRSV